MRGDADALLAFPLIFLVGLLPMCTTFALYLFEQLDMHLLGGTGLASFAAAARVAAMDGAALVLLYGCAFGAFWTAAADGVSPALHSVFALFSGALVALAYQLSVTDPRSDACVRSVARPDDPLLGGDRPDRWVRALVFSLITAALLGCVAAALQLTTLFTSLQPALSTVLYATAAGLGAFLHYLLPQLRKRHPFLLFREPVLRCAEYGETEATSAAVLTWFDRVHHGGMWFERHILYPLLFLSAVAQGASAVLHLFGPWCVAALPTPVRSRGCSPHRADGPCRAGPFVLSTAGLRALRGTYNDPAPAFAYVAITALFFRYDASGVTSGSFIVDYLFMTLLLNKAGRLGGAWLAAAGVDATWRRRQFYELVLKIQFVLVYWAPWNQPWGAGFHVIVQPLSLPRRRARSHGACP